MNEWTWIAFAAGLLIGALVSGLWVRTRMRQWTHGLLQQVDKEKELAAYRAAQAEKELTESRARVELLQAQLMQLTADLSQARTQVNQLHEFLENEKKEKQELNERLMQGFEVVAHRILDQTGKKLSEQQQKDLEQVLQPLRDRLSEFQRVVQETYDKEKRDVLSLQEQVRLLHEQNRRITEEAHNLARALKGDTRQQGKWGELILERILEFAGLEQGLEYTLQHSYRNRHGELIRPDAVVFLPEQKHLIIDAKVSLNAYERFVNTDSEEEKQKALQDHVLAVRHRVKELSDKEYFTGQELRSPEMVFMFIPVESAFMEALRADGELFNYAWERRIVLVGPSTLLATLRTVANLWKIEKQNRNAQEIARLSGKLYDKLCGLLSELENLGTALRKAEDEYNKFCAGLTSERENVLRLAERIRGMGANATKRLPAAFQEPAAPEEQQQIAPSAGQQPTDAQ
ncbi:MAG: DNA recombination protein RmuC [Chitinophagales bacterium]|nr:DNA recombination protein RmuC [Chitinophagales bacterium]MDW8428524.1 DNA recombination protein RmuC [Chitinophagales bacterium]